MGAKEPPKPASPMFILMGDTSLCLFTRQAQGVILDSSPPRQVLYYCLSISKITHFCVCTPTAILSPRMP